MSRHSSIGIARGYRLESLGSIPGRSKRIFSSPRCQDRLWDPTSLLFNGNQELFLVGMKWPGCEADYSRPSSVEVKDGGAYLHSAIYLFRVMLN
jgi:hypothetical protein